MLELIKALPQEYTLEIIHKNENYILELRKHTGYAASIYFREEELNSPIIKHGLVDKIKEMVKGIEELEKSEKGE